jgi:hypothetical protein
LTMRSMVGARQRAGEPGGRTRRVVEVGWVRDGTPPPW